MKMFSNYGRFASRFSWILCLLSLGQAIGAPAAKEETFDVLQIGTRTYTNVTVTTKTTNYIFMLHSSGMANIKVSELTAEAREKLGYPDPAKPKVKTNAASVWATQTIAKMETPQVKEVEQKVVEQWKSRFEGGKPKLPPVDLRIVGLAIGIFWLLYLFFSYCCMLICLKAGKPPGALVWLPILKVFPLLHAADMSYAWFIVYIGPALAIVGAASSAGNNAAMLANLALAGVMSLLQIVMVIMWCFKIAKACGKSAWVGLFLLLPFSSLFAFLYLAFSDSATEEKAPRSRRVPIMTLDTA